MSLSPSLLIESKRCFASLSPCEIGRHLLDCKKCKLPQLAGSVMPHGFRFHHSVVLADSEEEKRGNSHKKGLMKWRKEYVHCVFDLDQKHAFT